jgi:hypothetical protein
MSQVIEVAERYIAPNIPPHQTARRGWYPLESHKHRIQINLLSEWTRHRWQGRADFFACQRHGPSTHQ